MSPGPTFDRVYLALKEQLTGGRHAPGAHLEPSLLGEELNASITPVRDALHRLVGERLVEAPRNDGFRVPAPTEAELRDLYGWSRSLLELALRGPDRSKSQVPWRAAERQDEALADEATLFCAIARRAGSPEHEAALSNLGDRLASLRLAEAQVFADAAMELEALNAAWEARDLAGLRRGIIAYHRRRRRAVPDILQASRALPRDR